MKIFGLFSLLLALSGCATLFGDSSDTISLDSEPQGATVSMGGNVLCRTPCHADIPRKTETTYLVFKKQGYQPKTAILAKTVTGAAWWNLGFITTTSGGTSWGIDALSGKMFKYSPNSYIIELDKNVSLNQPGPSGLDFTMENFDRLKVEIARENGELYRDLCASYRLAGRKCETFEKRLHDSRAELMSTTNGVELYRKMQTFKLTL